MYDFFSIIDNLDGRLIVADAHTHSANVILVHEFHYGYARQSFNKGDSHPDVGHFTGFDFVI